VVDMQLGLRHPGKELTRHSHAGDLKESGALAAGKLTIRCQQPARLLSGPV
jgi:hypothetical protein